MTPAQAKNMLFTSRYAVDKIVFTLPDSFSAAGSSLAGLGARTEHSIPNTFGVLCLLELVYSIDSGSTWQDMDMQQPDLSTPSAPVFQTFVVAPYCTISNFVIAATNYTTSAQTVKFILTATWLS